MQNVEKVNRINEILESNVGNRIVSVTFRKKDGTMRQMNLMRSKRLEASVTGNNAEATEARRWTLRENGMKCVEEMTGDHKSQWRTINLNTVTQLKVGGQTYAFDL